MRTKICSGGGTFFQSKLVVYWCYSCCLLSSPDNVQCLGTAIRFFLECFLAIVWRVIVFKICGDGIIDMNLLPTESRHETSHNYWHDEEANYIAQPYVLLVMPFF